MRAFVSCVLTCKTGTVGWKALPLGSSLCYCWRWRVCAVNSWMLMLERSFIHSFRCWSSLRHQRQRAGGREYPKLVWKWVFILIYWTFVKNALKLTLCFCIWQQLLRSPPATCIAVAPVSLVMSAPLKFIPAAGGEFSHARRPWHRAAMATTFMFKEDFL